MFGKRIPDLPSRQLLGGHHMATDWWAWIWGGDTLSSPCVPPTLEEFKARFPEFEDYDENLIAQAILEASYGADGTWISTSLVQDCNLAIGYLAAHYLALGATAAQALPTTEEVTAGGDVTSISFETMKVSFSAPRFMAGSASSGSYEIWSTPYGQRYVELLKMNVPGILVV